MEFVTPNWLNLATTAAGFLVFVWLMAKFAWGPILSLLDRRRDDIQDDYAAAERNLAEAEQLKGEFELKLQDIKVIEREKVQEAVQRGEIRVEQLIGPLHAPHELGEETDLIRDADPQHPLARFGRSRDRGELV